VFRRNGVLSHSIRAVQCQQNNDDSLWRNRYCDQYSKTQCEGCKILGSWSVLRGVTAAYDDDAVGHLMPSHAQTHCSCLCGRGRDLEETDIYHWHCKCNNQQTRGRTSCITTTTTTADCVSEIRWTCSRTNSGGRSDNGASTRHDSYNAVNQKSI
jgi:hypothetical protein